MRKTSNDYRKELNTARTKVESLEAHIKARLITLVEQNPDAIVLVKGEDKFKAKCVSKQWLEVLPVDTMIEYIRAIEEHNMQLEPYVQVSMY